jgi:hypothetical protein
MRRNAIFACLLSFGGGGFGVAIEGGHHALLVLVAWRFRSLDLFFWFVFGVQHPPGRSHLSLTRSEYSIDSTEIDLSGRPPPFI